MSSRQRAQEARLRRLTRAAYTAAEGVPQDPGADDLGVGGPGADDLGVGDPGAGDPGAGDPGADGAADVAAWDEPAAGRARDPAGRGHRDHPRRRDRSRRRDHPRRLDRRALAGAGLALLALVVLIAVRAVALSPGDVLVADDAVAPDAPAATDDAVAPAATDPMDATAATDATAISSLAGPTRDGGGTPGPESTSLPLVVHVAGQVVEPGVVELPAGSRVRDAVVAAGGVTAEANVDAVNLARALVDGEQVYLPAKGEAVPGGAPVARGAPASSEGGLVNLNTAELAELDTLPGIGPALAERIIAWRTEHGGFRDVAELMDVSGIGPAVMARVRDLVTV